MGIYSNFGRGEATTVAAKAVENLSDHGTHAHTGKKYDRSPQFGISRLTGNLQLFEFEISEFLNWVQRVGKR